MNSELKTRWVDALRSGKYEQSQEGHLCKDGKYCCLGVLMDITAAEMKTIIKPKSNFKGEFLEFDGEHSWPSERHLMILFGKPFIPSVKIDGEIEDVATHNDSGATFEQLAKAIEEQL